MGKRYEGGIIGPLHGPLDSRDRAYGVWDSTEVKQRRLKNTWPKVNNGATDEIVSVTGVGSSVLTFASAANFDQYGGGTLVKAGAATTTKYGPILTVTSNSGTVYTGTVAANNTALDQGTFGMGFTNPGDNWTFAYTGVSAGQALRINPGNSTGVSITGQVNPTGTIPTDCNVQFTAATGSFTVTLAGSVGCSIESANHFWSVSGEIYSIDAANKQITLKSVWDRTAAARSQAVGSQSDKFSPAHVTSGVFSPGDRLYKWSRSAAFNVTNYDIG